MSEWTRLRKAQNIFPLKSFSGRINDGPTEVEIIPIPCGFIHTNQNNHKAAKRQLKFPKVPLYWHLRELLKKKAERKTAEKIKMNTVKYNELLS